MIVVTTPTGKIGSQLVPRLLAAGEKVRVIARDPSKLSPRFLDKVDVTKGSTDDPEVLSAAFEARKPRSSSFRSRSMSRTSRSTMHVSSAQRRKLSNSTQ